MPNKLKDRLKTYLEIERLKRELESSPDFEQIVTERPEAVQSVLLTVNGKEFFNPTVKVDEVCMKAADVLESVNRRSTGRGSKPQLPSEAVSELSL